ncbi:MAG: SRPBCC family protein [Bacteroidetes bacterium]|nr:SRPBCC family protein [Bacteroidota bacterium]
MTKTTMFFFGIVLGTILIAGIFLALIAPKRISITSTQFIQAPIASVYDQLRFMKNFPDWSPFRQQDPEQKFSVSGPDGQVGATYNWEGVKEKSKGVQQVIALKENEKVDIQCHITVPFQANPTFSYTLSEAHGGVMVQQQFDVDMPLPANIIGLLLGLKAKMAETNQQGLALLKKVAEQESETFSKR